MDYGIEMYEINKLRIRISNLSKNDQLFTMSVGEVRALLAEIDELINSKTSTAASVSTPPITTPTQHRIIDGGTFNR